MTKRLLQIALFPQHRLFDCKSLDCIISSEVLCSLKQASILDIKVVSCCLWGEASYTPLHLTNLPFPMCIRAALGKQLHEMTSVVLSSSLIHAYKHSGVTAAWSIMEFFKHIPGFSQIFPQEIEKSIFSGRGFLHSTYTKAVWFLPFFMINT